MAGIPDELFWEATLREVWMILEELADREGRRDRAETHRAAFIISGFFNARRTKKSDYVFKPTDFYKQPDVRLSPEESITAMRAWSKRVNQRFKA